MMMNVGVWGVRPDVRTFLQLLRFIRSGRYKCGIGFQDCAISFFSAGRWRERPPRHVTPNGSSAALHAGYNLKADVGGARCTRARLALGWRYPLLPSAPVCSALSGSALLLHPILLGRSVSPSRSFSSLALFSLDTHTLVYSLCVRVRAATSCLAQRGLRAPDDVYVVHWSGVRKPERLTTVDPLERRHLLRWQAAHQRWTRALELGQGSCR
jgi:hypothetical protein